MQLGFYFDQTRCTGCFACMVACKDWNDIPAGPASWIRVAIIERGKFPNTLVTFVLTACFHCDKPLCVEHCPVNAIYKRKKDGIVLVDSEKCLGKDDCAMFCRDACPYNAPQFTYERDSKMRKCDFCAERWLNNQKPICVEACPTYALDAGPLNELIARYGDVKEGEGFAYSPVARPSIVLKSKKG